MKITKKYVKADATSTAIAKKIDELGTIFYKLTLDMVLDYFSGSKENCWIWKSFDELGWDCLDLSKNLIGSRVIGDDFYLCITDGENIMVGDSEVVSESALEEYDIEDLQEYILPGDKGIIRRYITEDEIYTPYFDKWAGEMIEKDGYDFTEMVKFANEFYDFTV